MKKLIYTQKRAYDMKACIMSVSCLFIFAGCKPLEMFRHTEKGTDTYCVFKITSVTNTGTTQALKKGDVICIYCTGPDHCVLYTKRWIKVYEVEGDPTPGHIFIKKDIGISYYLEADDPNASCTTCPGTNKFEFFYN